MADRFQAAPPLNLNVTEAPQVAVEPAGFWIRFVAVFVDGMIFGFIQYPLRIPAYILTMVMGNESTLASGLSILWMVVAYIASFYFYFGWFYSNKGATPGKLLVNIRVLRDDTGTHLSYGQAIGREFLGKFLSALTLGIGYFLAAFREDKKALHDLVFSTRVVRVRK